MTDDGSHLTAEEGRATTPELLRSVRENRRTIRIVSTGSPLADLRPVTPTQREWPDTSDLRALEINGDPAAPLDEQDWPDDLR